MKKYQFNDFNAKNTWLVVRLNVLIDTIIDTYLVMDLPSGMILTSDVTETELSQKQVDGLLERALFKNGKAPEQILLPSNDPVELFLQKSAKKLGVAVESVPSISLEDLLEPIRSTFSKELGFSEEDDELDYEDPVKSLPDSYDLCSCGSGSKYKFCCKRILTETVESMVSAEDGDFEIALKWINKARNIVGNTAEVLCRESIIYSFFDKKKSKELLKQCLEVNPKHPRAYYLIALDLTQRGDLQEAVDAYEKAIAYYPATDRYHLNEARNNLGLVYYRMGNHAMAKVEWELAVQLLPADKLARRNLQDFIYNKKKKSKQKEFFSWFGR